MIRILVQENDFNAGAELARLQIDGVGGIAATGIGGIAATGIGGIAATGIGGIASFIGTVRANPDDNPRLAALYLEHYPGMTERALTKIAEQAVTKFPLKNCTIIHRVGRLVPGENIVFVGAASAHRQVALSATAFLIDWLKTSAPLWKREDFTSGVSIWVAARAADDLAAEKWIK